jgi:hypothetical protein
MGLFHRKPKIEKKSYDREHERPVLRCSICTGEQVAGFQNLATGKFSEVCLIRTGEDLKQFMETYDITEPVEKIY